MKGIKVESEIGQLRKVLLHRPGKELQNLTPDTLGELLFDDIPFLKVAQEEHDAFAKVLTDNGVECVYIEDLIAEVLEDAEVKEKFLKEWLDESGLHEESVKLQVKEWLLKNYPNNKDLVMKTVEGIRASEIKIKKGDSLNALVNEKEQSLNLMLINPMPNLYFTRDPFASIGDGPSIHRMWSVTRNRETLYAKYMFRHHPDFKDCPNYYNRKLPFHVEGGDVMILGKNIIAVGISQRTEPDAIELLASNLFAKNKNVKTVLAIKIPSSRAFMHLDTVFTQVDKNKFTYMGGAFETIDIYELTQNKGAIAIKKTSGTLEEILKKYVGKAVELIPCAGGDKILAQAEQWNDGSNTLAIAPGKVVCYQRNTESNKLLREKGLTVFEIPSAELSRGRGGPRCMSMPLWRDDVK
jgi:arginine deiminase